MIYQPEPIGRVCRRCGQWFPRPLLRRNKKQPDGVEKQCLNCCREEATNYFYGHHDEVLEKRRQEYEQFPGRVKGRNKRNRDKPERKAKTLKRVNRWQQEHPDNVRENKRKYAQVHLLDRRPFKRLLEERRRARKMSLPDTFTAKDWERCLKYWHGRCAVCGRPVGLWHTIAADHWIPLSSSNCPGTVSWNILPLCHSQKGGEGGCNNTKWNHDPVKWLIKKLGQKAGKAKLAEIDAYFALVKR